MVFPRRYGYCLYSLSSTSALVPVVCFRCAQLHGRFFSLLFQCPTSCFDMAKLPSFGPLYHPCWPFSVEFQWHSVSTRWSSFRMTLMSISACVQLALNDISPSPETLGTINAIALAAQSGLRSVAPAVATSLYAIGVKYRILDGQLFWLCQVILACGLFAVLRFLPAKARGDVKFKLSNGGA